MSTANDGPRPHWGGAANEWRPRLGSTSGPSVPAGPTEVVDLDAVLREIQELRRSMEDRFRALNHRIEALDTDMLRLVTLVRTAAEREPESPRTGISVRRASGI